MSATIKQAINSLKTRIASVYAHLRERLEGTEEKPLAEGVPVRPLPQPQDLAHLQEAVKLLDTRKIDTGSLTDGVPDGVSLVRLLCDSSIASQVTEIRDANSGWTYAVSNMLLSMLNAMTAVTKVTLNCSAITASMVDRLDNRDLEFHLPECRNTFASGLIILRGNNISVHLDAMEVFQQTNYTAYGNFYTGAIYFPVIKQLQFRLGGHAGYSNDTTRYVYLGCKGEPTDEVRVYNGYNYRPNPGNYNTSVTDVEIRDGARQAITLDSLIGITAENIVNHIFNRLADNNDGDPITITLGSTNLAKLTDTEKQIAIDKNYILA